MMDGRLLEENQRRNALLDAPYDPLTGMGSPMERQMFELSDMETSLYLPMSMLNLEWIDQLGEAGSFHEFARLNANHPMLRGSNDALGTIKDLFLNTRCDHDFEFWAYIGITILDKDNFKYIPFRLRGAQRILLLALESMRLAGVPIRIVLLKARQWGGSTLVQFYMMWIQQRLRENFHMIVCAQDEGAAKNIRQMYIKAAETYPEELGTITFRPYAKSPKNDICVETGGILGVGSVQNPSQFRSYNYAMAHLSEVGTWQDTPKKSAMELVGALKETVPDQPETVIVEESTAKGLNYFYDSYTAAEQGKNRYKAVFIPWWQIDRCRIEVKDPGQFVRSWTDYQLYQWSLGGTIEGIAWYAAHQADKKYSDWQMMEENPATPDEAFQSSGQKVFPPKYIQAMRKDNRDPEFIGDVFGDSRMGKKALQNIRFEKFPNGHLKIWEMPDKENKYTHRYVVPVDIGGKTDKADYSIIRVIDRIGLLDTYKPHIKLILTWKGHTDPDLLAWKAAQIAKMYDDALLVPEANSLKKTKEEEGEHFLTILNNIKDDYPNIYIRNNEENVGDEFVPKYGFQTTTASKGKAIDALNAAARERHMMDTDEQDGVAIYEYDKENCDEMSWFETKDDGSQGAVKGKHDDEVVTTAIGSQVAIHEMPYPRLKPQNTPRPRSGHRSESSF